MNPLVPALIGTVLNAIQAAPDQALPGFNTPLRTIPVEAQRAEMFPPHDGRVVIGGRDMRLSAATQIRSSQNLLVVPASLQEAVLVRYTTDGSGYVHRIWILSAEEAARPDPKQ